MTVADLVAECLALDLHDAETAHVEAVATGAAYRHLACAALDRLATLTSENDQLRRRLLDQQEQIRQLMGLSDDRRRQEAAAKECDDR